MTGCAAIDVSTFGRKALGLRLWEDMEESEAYPRRVEGRARIPFSLLSMLRCGSSSLVERLKMRAKERRPLFCRPGPVEAPLLRRPLPSGRTSGALKIEF